MDIENFIAEFKKTFVYDMLSMSLKDEQLFEHVVDDDGVLWFKEQTRQMWSMWQEAKAQAVPEGFVLVPKEPTQELLNKMQDFFVGAFENGLTGGQSIHCAYKAMIEAQEQTNDK